MQITHAKRVCKDFEIRNLREYHDLHVQRDKLLFPDVFKNFRNFLTYMNLILQNFFQV